MDGRALDEATRFVSVAERVIGASRLASDRQLGRHDDIRRALALEAHRRGSGRRRGLDAAGTDYLNALNLADGGDLRAFSDYLGGLGLVALIGANQLARQALAGNLERVHGNGGCTVGDEYRPPPARSG